ncbi:hypothetical protein [Rathayibacter soli]|nr:hypothetical protein [Glaciibacter superstes]
MSTDIGDRTERSPGTRFWITMPMRDGGDVRYRLPSQNCGVLGLLQRAS